MKKAKFLLSLTSVLSLLSAMVAFNVHRNNPHWFCTSIRTATCSLKAFTTMDPTTASFCSTTVSKSCPATLVAIEV